MTETSKEEPNTTRRRSWRRSAAAAALALAAVAVGATLYGMMGVTGKHTAAVCAPTKAVAARVDPFAHGEVAAFSPAKSPDLLPPLSFTGPGGAKTTLSDFKGRTVLVNIWATWCVPCRREMPALDKLQAQLGGPDFQVVAVNIDTSRLERPPQFLADVGAKNLVYFSDPSADVFQVLRAAGKVTGLPTSFLVDGNGCEIGSLAGGADWASPDGLALVKAALGA